jgi:uncharacterized protein (DUF2147 family)
VKFFFEPWVIAGVSLFLLSGAAAADVTPPEVGLWQTFDDKTGKPNGAVRIFMQDGRLNGMIERLPAGTPGDAKCIKCSGAQKDKPILGLLMMWGLHKDGDAWSGGSVLDPDTGDTYRCTIRYFAPDKLELRGYIGIPLFGRTQTWRRTQ